MNYNKTMLTNYQANLNLMQRIEYDTHITQRTRHGVLPKILVECIMKGSFTYDVWWKMG